MAIATLSWLDRKGAGRSERGNAVKLARKLETLRCVATLRNPQGEIIGGCQRAFEGESDDRRVKWIWWYDEGELR